MIIRDKLSTFERYEEILARQSEYIIEEQEDLTGYDPISDKKKIIDTYDTILKYSLDNLLVSYSMGSDLDTFKENLQIVIDSMEKVWRQSNGYVQMVWVLSFGIMLDINIQKINKLKDLVQQDNPNDYLIDFLLNSKTDWALSHTDFKFPVPYKSLKDVISLALENRKNEAVLRLKEYLDKEWYKGHSDTGWYNSHSSKYNIYSGYWSWESGALVKILGLDDTILKDQQYYPYDMVHWKD